MPKLFELSNETKALINYLRSLEKGTSVTYAEISRLTGVKVDARHAKLIYARLILKRDHNAVWIAIRPRVGLQRLTDVEIAERLPGWWLNGARNKLRRGGNEIDIVETDKLNAVQLTRFSVDSIQRELAFESLSKATRRKMEKVSRGTSNDMPSFTAVEWAISLNPKK
jgi:alkylated DNA nucleotide flippase Atl1